MKFRKTAALLLSALLLGGNAPAYAADTEAAGPSVLTVGYTGIEAYVRSSNQTIRANAKTLKALRNNDLAQQKIDDIDSSRSSLSGVSSMLQQADAAVRAMPSSAEIQAIDASLLGSIASISAISSVLGSEEDQLSTDDDKVDETELEMNEAADQIVIAAQNLFITYNALQTQRTLLTEQRNVLTDALKAARTKAGLGLMTQTDLENHQQDLTAVSDGLSALVSQMQTVKDNLRVLLGYPQDYDLDISSMPAPDLTEIVKMNHDADYSTALGANWTLREKQKEIDIADENYDSDLDSTVDNRNAAELTYDGAKNTFDALFRQVYNGVGDKQSRLKSAQTAYDAKVRTLDAVKQENALGVASPLDVENAQLDADSAGAARDQAQTVLFTAQGQYRWALLGDLNSNTIKS